VQFTLDDQQAQVERAVATLLDRRAGPKRMRELGGDEPAYDTDLDAALDTAGFTRICLGGAGPVDAALVTEAIARRLGVVAFGAAALVAAGALGEIPDGPIAITTPDHRGPVRYAADARTMLVCGDTEAWCVPIAQGRYERVRSRFGYPLGFVDAPRDRGERLDAVAARLRSWWQVALAVEMAGTMQAALALTVQYVTERKQFGRPIGSFQALQHRLAEAKVSVEAAHWLALEAAWLGAPPDAAATALTYAAAAAPTIVTECHQLSGAIGFTTDYDLHLWTTRLPALTAEARWL
jgi:alkylation response protein AidB-like acyl-CoA dehydrogenase